MNFREQLFQDTYNWHRLEGHRPETAYNKAYSKVCSYDKLFQTDVEAQISIQPSDTSFELLDKTI